MARSLGRVLQYVRGFGAQGSAPGSDQELLQEFGTQRSESAFAEIVNRHGRMVLGVCRRILGNAELAEDAYQATFLVLARRSGSLEVRSLGAWLYGVACKVALTAKADRARRTEHEREAILSRQRDHAMDSEELQSCLDEELRRLPSKFREPIVLCYLEGKTRDEAAQELGWAKTSLHRRLENGCEILRKRLERHRVALSTTALLAFLEGESRAAPLSPRLLEAVLTLAQVTPGGPVTRAALLAEATARAFARERIRTGILFSLIALPIVAGGVLWARSVWDGWTAATSRNSSSLVDSFELTHSGTVTQLAFPAKPDCLIAVSADPLDSGSKKLVVWDLDKRAKRSEVELPADMKSLVGIAPDCRRAVFRGDNRVAVWDIETGRSIADISTNLSGIVALSPDGNVLASVQDEGIDTWNLVEKEKKFIRVPIPPKAMTFCNDRILGTLDSTRTIRLWDVEKGNSLIDLDAGAGAAIQKIAFSPDGSIVAALVIVQDDVVVHTWNVESGKRFGQVVAPEFRPFLSAYPDLAVADNRVALAAVAWTKYLVHAWDPRNERLNEVVSGKAEVAHWQLSPDARWFAIGDLSRVVKVFDIDKHTKSVRSRRGMHE